MSAAVAGIRLRVMAGLMALAFVIALLTMPSGRVEDPSAEGGG
jgi:hypothetical protein